MLVDLRMNIYVNLGPFHCGRGMKFEETSKSLQSLTRFIYVNLILGMPEIVANFKEGLN